MRYAVIFTRNDGWSGVTTVEAIKPTYEEALVEAEKQVSAVMKTQKIKGSVQDNIKNGIIEFCDDDFCDNRIKANYVITKSKIEVLVQEIPE